MTRGPTPRPKPILGSDQIIHCVECGTPFLFTAWERRRWAEEHGETHLPLLCPGCRALEHILAPQEENASWEEGRVKWYDGKKGFGVLVTEAGDEIFVHSSRLPKGVRRLRAGQAVRFQRENGPQGPRAARLRIVRARRRDDHTPSTEVAQEP
ncbi:MAG: cold shock domain-containing protein [Anaerolineae bacterium]